MRDKRNPKIVEIMLGMHVADSIVSTSDADGHLLTRFLKELLPMNDLGELTYYACCLSERDCQKRTLKINQTACINHQADPFDFPSTRLVHARSSVRLRARREGEGACTERYRRTMGGLL